VLCAKKVKKGGPCVGVYLRITETLVVDAAAAAKRIKNSICFRLVANYDLIFNLWVCK
jgi:hypothetical protein